MGWVQCIGQNGGGTNKSIELIYVSTTSTASETFTITEDGLYLIGAGHSARGSSTIILPVGVTTISSGTYTVDTSYPRGFTYAVAQLNAGDVITIGSTPSSWNGHGRFIAKLNGFGVGSGNALDSVIVADDTASYTLVDDSDYLVIGFCCGGSASRHKQTLTSDISDIDLQQSVSNGLMMFRVSLISDAQGAVYTEYGYEGGVSVIVVLSAIV